MAEPEGFGAKNKTVQWTVLRAERAEPKRGAGKTDGSVIPPGTLFQ